MFAFQAKEFKVQLIRIKSKGILYKGLPKSQIFNYIFYAYEQGCHHSRKVNQRGNGLRLR